MTRRSLTNTQLVQVGTARIESIPRIREALSRPGRPFAFSGQGHGGSAYKVALHLFWPLPEQDLRTLQHTGSGEPMPELAHCIVDRASGISGEPLLVAPDLLTLAEFVMDYASGLYTGLETQSRCLDLLAEVHEQDELWRALPAWIRDPIVDRYRTASETDELVVFRPRPNIDYQAQHVTILRFLKSRQVL